MELAHGVAVVHGVESGDLVDSHGRHLQDARNLVHDTDAGETVLSLAEVEKRHDGGLLVLAGVAGKDFLDELLILGVELEGNVEIVVGSVAVLRGGLLEEWRGKAAARGAAETYHVDALTSGGGRDAELALLLAHLGAQNARAASESPGSEFGGHCGGVCGW